jgi:MFS family permease
MSTTVQQAAAVQAVDEQQRYRWPVVTLFALGMAIAYFDRVCLSIALPAMVAGGIALSDTQQGIALGAFFWSYTALQIPSGVLVDRIGVRAPYLWGYLLWCVASAGTALTTTLGFLIAVRLLLGIGESVVTPAAHRYIRAHFQEKQRGNAIGLYMTGTKLGPALGFPITAYLVSQFGWQTMFVLMGLGGLIFLYPFLGWVKKDDPAALPRARREAEKIESRSDRVSAWAIMRSPVMWGVILGTFCYMYFVYYCITWMPIYFKREYNMSLTEIGWYTGFSFGGMSILIWLGGWAADWFIARGADPVNVRKWFTIVGFTLASTQTISLLTDNLDVKLFFAVFSLAGLGLATANYWALTQTLIPGGSIASVVGIQNTAANLAGIVAPTLTGWLIDRTGSFDAPIKWVGVWLVLGIAGYVFLVRRKYAPRFQAASN